MTCPKCQHGIAKRLGTYGRKRIFDKYVQNLTPRFVRAEELFCYVHTKQARPNEASPTGWGDTYAWLTTARGSDLILNYHVGKRNTASSFEFVRGSSKRIVSRFQLTPDRFKPYRETVEHFFGNGINFGQFVKFYAKAQTSGPEWNAPTVCIDAVTVPVAGNPKATEIFTSHIDRMNLFVRMRHRRYTRLTNAFSKALKHLKAAVSVLTCWYSFCHALGSIRVTPTLETGPTDHVWSVRELLGAATRI